MKLSKAKMERLDNRYTAYNPDQEIDGPDALVDLVCPIHGPYRTRSEKLRQKYFRRTMHPPDCPGCKAHPIKDREYIAKIAQMWSIYIDGNPYMFDPEDYPISPDFAFMAHWKAPIL